MAWPILIVDPNSLVCTRK